MYKPTPSLLALASCLALAHGLAAQPPRATLQAEAKISQEQATTTALALNPAKLSGIKRQSHLLLPADPL